MRHCTGKIELTQSVHLYFQNLLKEIAQTKHMAKEPSRDSQTFGRLQVLSAAQGNETSAVGTSTRVGRKRRSPVRRGRTLRSRGDAEAVASGGAL